MAKMAHFWQYFALFPILASLGGTAENSVDRFVIIFNILQ